MKLMGGFLGLLLLLVSGCGGGDAEDWDSVVDVFVESTCDLESQCFSQDEAACIADVEQDMADARAEVGASGEAACIECMRVKDREARKITGASCDLTAGDVDAVLAACDLDPTTDYDGDQNPSNDDDEACAGYP